jgi:hypothetical protein
MLLNLHEENHDSFAIPFVSDGQLPFDWASPKEMFAWIHHRTSRSTDVLMRRITSLELSLAKKYFDKESLIRCEIGDPVPKDGSCQPLDESIQRQAAKVRTDLNRFTDAEIDVLVRFGYISARAACVRGNLIIKGHEVLKMPPWSPVDASKQAKPGDLDHSDKQPLWPIQRNWLSVGIIAFVALWISVFYFAHSVLVTSSAWLWNSTVNRPRIVKELPTVLSENLNNIKYLSLSATEMQAKELLERTAINANGGQSDSLVILRLTTGRIRDSTGGHPSASFSCQLTYRQPASFRAVGHCAFRVHPTSQGGKLYEALEAKGPDRNGAYSFEVPICDPDDSLLLFVCMKNPGKNTIPEDLGSLVNLEVAK